MKRSLKKIASFLGEEVTVESVLQRSVSRRFLRLCQCPPVFIISLFFFFYGMYRSLFHSVVLTLLLSQPLPAITLNNVPVC